MNSSYKKPLIGITRSSVPQMPKAIYASDGKTDYTFGEYTKAIELSGGRPLLISLSGGRPLLISPTQNSVAIKEVIDRIDGLLLSGGPDIGLGCYEVEPSAEVKEICYPADMIEIDALRQAEERGIPILGICRGLQIMAVAFGGTLIQDIPTEIYKDLKIHHGRDSIEHYQKDPRSIATHKVRVFKNSKLFDVVRIKSLLVNSKHHQAVRKPPRGFMISAVAGDGVIEAMEKLHHPFCLGVQWHPESLRDDASRRIYSAFVETATRNRLKSAALSVA